jgi:RHS repeat-associated protein
VTGGSDTYTHDADGNLVTITGSRAFSATVDPQNRMTAMSLNGTSTTYTYDGLENRVKATTGSTVRNYHYDHMGRLLFETDNSGYMTAIYVYAGAKLVAIKESGSSYFYHYDKLGNTVALTGSTGAIANAYAYLPFGELANSLGTLYNPFTYVGAYGVMSEGSNIYFMKNRYYDAVSGRFLQKDPLGFGSGDFNSYAYVGSNVVNRIDPFGLKPGDPFRTKDEAGIDAIKYINLKSISKGTEYGGWIYQNADGTYSYTSPVPGSAATTNLGQRPITGTICGDYHTHGSCTVGYINENFSPQDKIGYSGFTFLILRLVVQDILTRTFFLDKRWEANDVGYLGTPSEAILKYYAPTNGIITLTQGNASCKK